MNIIDIIGIAALALTLLATASGIYMDASLIQQLLSFLSPAFSYVAASSLTQLVTQLIVFTWGSIALFDGLTN